MKVITWYQIVTTALKEKQGKKWKKTGQKCYFRGMFREVITEGQYLRKDLHRVGECKLCG